MCCDANLYGAGPLVNQHVETDLKQGVSYQVHLIEFCQTMQKQQIADMTERHAFLNREPDMVFD